MTDVVGSLKLNVVDVAVGREIRKARLSAGLSLAEAAGIIGVSEGEFAEYEEGTKRLRAHAMFTLCEGLDIELKQLLSSVEVVDQSSDST